MNNYDRTQVVLPELSGAKDWRVMNDTAEVTAIAAANELDAKSLSDEEVADILAFLKALNDPAALAGRLGVPNTVPSGLAVEK